MGLYDEVFTFRIVEIANRLLSFDDLMYFLRRGADFIFLLVRS